MNVRDIYYDSHLNQITYVWGNGVQMTRNPSWMERILIFLRITRRA